MMKEVMAAPFRGLAKIAEHVRDSTSPSDITSSESVDRSIRSMQKADKTAQFFNRIADKRAALPGTKLTAAHVAGAGKAVGGALKSVGSTIASGALNTMKAVAGSPGRALVAGAILAPVAFASSLGGSAIQDISNTNPYSGDTARALHSWGGMTGLGAMAFLAGQDQSSNLSGKDFIQAQAMSRSSNRGNKYGNMGATGDLALSLSDLRRGR